MLHWCNMQSMQFRLIFSENSVRHRCSVLIIVPQTSFRTRVSSRPLFSWGIVTCVWGCRLSVLFKWHTRHKPSWRHSCLSLKKLINIHDISSSSGRQTLASVSCEVSAVRRIRHERHTTPNILRTVSDVHNSHQYSVSNISVCVRWQTEVTNYSVSVLPR